MLKSRWTQVKVASECVILTVRRSPLLRWWDRHRLQLLLHRVGKAIVWVKCQRRHSQFMRCQSSHCWSRPRSSQSHQIVKWHNRGSILDRGLQLRLWRQLGLDLLRNLQYKVRLVSLQIDLYLLHRLKSSWRPKTKKRRKRCINSSYQKEWERKEPLTNQPYQLTQDQAHRQLQVMPLPILQFNQLSWIESPQQTQRLVYHQLGSPQVNSICKRSELVESKKMTIYQ